MNCLSKKAERYLLCWQSMKTDWEKNVLFLRSRYLSCVTLPLLLFCLFYPSFAHSGEPFTAAPPDAVCKANAKLKRATHTKGSSRFKYVFEGQCPSFCMNHEENEMVTFRVESAYEESTEQAAEVITISDITGDEIGKVTTSMDNCYLDPFKQNGPSSTICKNRKHATGGVCFQGYTHVFEDFATEGMVPWNVTYEEVDASPPPPPPPPDAYRIKRIISPEGLIQNSSSEITFDLEPFSYAFPPNRIVAHWESVAEGPASDGSAQGTKFTTSHNKPQAELKWSYYEKVPTDWNEFPLQVPLSFFPSNGAYRVRVVAETPDGKWKKPTDWSYFSIVQAMKSAQQGSVPTLKPTPDLKVTDIQTGSAVNNGKKSWRFQWIIENMGSTGWSDDIPLQFNIRCEVIKGWDAAEEMCVGLRDTRNLPVSLAPGQTTATWKTDPVVEPDGLFQIKITGVVDPENLISEGYVGEKNNEMNYILSSSMLQQKADFLPQAEKSDQFGGKKSKYPSMEKQMKETEIALKPDKFNMKTVTQAKLVFKNRPETTSVVPKRPVAGKNKSFRLSDIWIRNNGNGIGKLYRLQIQCKDPEGKKCGGNYRKNINVINLTNRFVT